MTGIHSRASKLSLSAAGILALIMFVGTVCVPRELRADAAARMVSLAEDLDAALADTWHLAFPARGSDRAAAASTSHQDGILHAGAALPWAGVDALPSGATGTATIDVTGFGTSSLTGSFSTGSFSAGYSAASAPNSMAGLLNDILKDDNSGPGARAGIEELVLAGTGNASAGFRAGDYAAGVRTSTGGIALAGFSRAVSTKAATPSSEAATPSHDRNVEGMPALAVVNPNAHNAYPDAHQERVAASGGDSQSASDAAGPSGNQGGSSGTLSDALSSEPATTSAIGGSSGTPSGPLRSELGIAPPIVGAVSDWSSAPHDGGVGGNADPTIFDPVTPLLNGLDQPLQGDGHQGSVYQNEVNDEDASGSGDGNVPDFNNPPGSDSHPEDHGAVDKPVALPDPNPGLIGSVPEPGSLALLSLALGAVILWRTFLSAH